MLTKVELKHDRRSLGFCDIDEKVRVVLYGGAYFADTGASANFVREFQMSPDLQVVERTRASAQ